MYLSSLLLATFLGGVLGVAAELVLLEHYEDVWQVVPLGLFAVGAGTAGWYWRRPGPASLRAFQVTLAGYVASAAIGLILHYRGNVEFAMETYPELAGLALVWEALTGATPALSPGTMALLGMVGYAAIVARRT